MDLPLNEISTIINVSLGIGGIFAAIFQYIFFRKIEAFPIKPEQEFVLKYLERREIVILTLIIIFMVLAVLLSMAVVINIDLGDWVQSLFYFAIQIIICTGVFIVYQMYILGPMSVRFLRSFFIALNYSEEEFETLIKAIDESEDLHSKDLIFEALGRVYKYE